MVTYQRNISFCFVQVIMFVRFIKGIMPLKVLNKWPFDAAITIALFALFLSVVQLFLNTPVLVNFYMEPELVVRGSGSDPKADVLIGMFEVNNSGRASATNVEIGLTVQEDQRVSLMPNIEADITEDKEPVFIKKVRIKIPKLTSGETVVILAVPGPSNEKLKDELADFFVRSGIKEIPMIDFIKSDQGMGKNLTNSIDRELMEKGNINKSNRIRGSFSLPLSTPPTASGSAPGGS